MSVAAPADAPLEEAVAVREQYEAALRPRRFDDPSRTHVAIGVYTTDLSEGRGDVYVAVGLGRHLESHGYEVVHLHRDEWYETPDGTDVFVSLLAEPTVMFDPRRLDPDILRIAWVRNNTARWVDDPHTPLYDAVVCASERSRHETARVHPGPTGLLPIGVDADLFVAGEDADRHPRDSTRPLPASDVVREGVVSTVNQWGDERQVLSALRRMEVDFPLALYGTHRGLADSLEPYAAGPVSYFALPSLYRRTALVLDDQQDVNRGHGSVNSRVFEALACGALPITNTRLGLRAVGLDDVPSYETPEDLRALIRDLGGDDARRRELVGRLRQVVLGHHTYADRAETLDAFLTEHGLLSRRERPAGFPVVGFVPDYTVTNPYQRMLYARLVEHGMAAVPVEDFDGIGEMSRLLGDRLVLHVHWTAPVVGPALDAADARDRLDRFVAALDGVRSRGGRIVWTVHNLLPHDAIHVDVQAELRAALAERADLVHVMCERTVDLAEAHYPIPRERVRVIPHASYVDVYPNVVDRSRARELLGIGEGEKVVLFFGQVRPYKGVEQLLDAFEAVRGGDGPVRLVVAGNPGLEAAVRPIVQRIEAASGVDAHLRIIPDEELQTFLLACDVVALPYKAALNSGALHLALSFGRPAVAPDVGCLPSGLPEGTGVVYDPESETGLADALREALASFAGPAQAETERRCYAAASGYTYLDMAEAFADATGGLFSGTAGTERS